MFDTFIVLGINKKISSSIINNNFVFSDVLSNIFNKYDVIATNIYNYRMIRNITLKNIIYFIVDEGKKTVKIKQNEKILYEYSGMVDLHDFIKYNHKILFICDHKNITKCDICNTANKVIIFQTNMNHVHLTDSIFSTLGNDFILDQLSFHDKGNSVVVIVKEFYKIS